MFRLPVISLALLTIPGTLVQSVTPEVCIGHFLELGFDLGRFDLYQTFFHEDSVMQLAQAGSYTGPDDIAEYVGFATKLSPFIEEGPIRVASGFQFAGFNEAERVCEFVAPSVSRLIMDPATTRYAADFNLAFMVKIFFNLDENYVPRVNVYYQPGFLEFFFDILLNSDATRNFVCDTVVDVTCAGIVRAEDHQQCIADLEDLPSVTGSLIHFDGNSQGCRALHSAFALVNPQNHCAHVSLTPLEDPKNRFKCQSSNLVSPNDLFTQADFDFFEDFMMEQGIGPVGMDEDCCEGNWCDEVDPRGWLIAEQNSGKPIPGGVKGARKGSKNNGNGSGGSRCAEKNQKEDVKSRSKKSVRGGN